VAKIDWSKAEPPTLADIEVLADEAYRSIPEELRAQIANVQVRVVDYPDDATLDRMGLESPFDLLGLYSGVDLTRQGVNDVRSHVDMIWLYRMPLLDYWCDKGGALGPIVRHVMIHEIGHHFGYSDDDMDELAGPM
jgi:predicted Zn-dependent protease with MMP-like domain